MEPRLANLDDAAMDSFLDEHVSELELEVRIVNALEKVSIFTISDLLHCTAERLLSIPNFGAKTLEHIYTRLETKGFYRSGKPKDDTTAEKDVA